MPRSKRKIVPYGTLKDIPRGKRRRRIPKTDEIKIIKMGDRYLQISGWIANEDLRKIRVKVFVDGERIYIYTHEDILKIKRIPKFDKDKKKYSRKDRSKNEYPKAYKIIMAKPAELLKIRATKNFIITPIEENGYFVGRQLVPSDYSYLRIKGWLDRKKDYKKIYHRLNEKGLEYVLEKYPNVRLRTEKEIEKRRAKATGRIVIIGHNIISILLRTYEMNGKEIEWNSNRGLANFDKAYLYMNGLMKFDHTNIKTMDEERETIEENKTLEIFEGVGAYLVRRWYKNLEFIKSKKLVADDDFDMTVDYTVDEDDYDFSYLNDDFYFIRIVFDKPLSELDDFDDFDVIDEVLGKIAYKATQLLK